MLSFTIVQKYNNNFLSCTVFVVVVVFYKVRLKIFQDSNLEIRIRLKILSCENQQKIEQMVS